MNFLPEVFARYENGFEALYEICKPYTATSRERMQALYASTHYVIDEEIPGDLVECGVYRGGSVMLMLGVLKERGISGRRVWMHDTFEGMTEATEFDVDLLGISATQAMDEGRANKEASDVWCYAPFDLVRANVQTIGYPMQMVEMVKGPVESTIPGRAPQTISLLRLDTDFYESSLHELQHLYPRVSQNGVLIIDDYGHWQGCQKAVDEFFPTPPPLAEIDYTGRAMLKAA
jgi:O-methyltransferase